MIYVFNLYSTHMKQIFIIYTSLYLEIRRNFPHVSIRFATSQFIIFTTMNYSKGFKNTFASYLGLTLTLQLQHLSLAQ